MKILLMALCVGFTIAMFIRIMEMSFQFDGADIWWTAVFMIGALICGAASRETL
ncbi:hypothetical protein SEA_GIANTSBANE_82 [Arthrobacter phage Giantsbane]|nr:hypothetical protein SEA_GIANTSBANE_82 [Arthrobacter phage Giantsbane]